MKANPHQKNNEDEMVVVNEIREKEDVENREGKKSRGAEKGGLVAEKGGVVPSRKRTMGTRPPFIAHVGQSNDKLTAVIFSKDCVPVWVTL